MTDRSEMGVEELELEEEEEGGGHRQHLPLQEPPFPQEPSSQIGLVKL
jgi:hypothetical protein